MHHVCAPKKMHVGLLALVLGALITGSAAAAGQQVIPYLSHGVGVDESVYSGTSTTSTKTPTVIPYLSHGHGVDQSLYVGGSHHLRRTAATAPVAKAVPDAFERAADRREQSETAALRTASAAKAVPDALDRALAREDVARESAFARPDDREGLRGINPTSVSGVTSSTSLRPDDRSGSRGIGVTTSTVETASSSSSTDWSPAFYAGAGFVGAMLVAGGAFALSRRQHGGVATH
jgi:hypothetical protein